MMAVNVVCIVLLATFNKIDVFVNDEGKNEYEVSGFFAFKYLDYSVIPILICSLIFFDDFERQNENIYHLGNLIDFILISFLPFLFVIQKDQTPPMKNIYGYFMLIPLIALGTFCLALLYFFISNLKSSNLFSIINMILIFYIFVANDIFLSYISRGLFMIGLLLLCLNFPVANKIASFMFNEEETLEEDIFNENSNNKKSLKLDKNLETIKETDEERKCESDLNSIKKELTRDKDDSHSGYSIELKENKLKEKLLSKN
jgi:hypothetical protein